MKIKETGKKRHGNATHDLSGTAAYKRWSGMRNRCHNPRGKDFYRYGARGIRVCERWNSFENFQADMGDCPSGHSIDRIDNDGDYEPSNCRWATVRQQQNNTRTNHVLSAFGRSLTIADWARETGLSQCLFHNRLRAGWPIEKVITQPRAYRKCQTA